MPAKVCPRCGAQYQNLKSTTCPQCFAVLVPVDDATAEELAAARREVEETPEFQAAKAADDERFREQSFGACLGVVVITALTLIVAVIIVTLAAHRHSPAVMRSTPVPVAVRSGTKSFTTLPVAAATLDDVLPAALGPYRRIAGDQNTVLTGTLIPLFHAVYTRPGALPLDIYALPDGLPTSEQNEFRLSLTLASQVGGAPHPLLFFETEYWHFAALAAPGQTSTPSEFRDAMLAHFRMP